MKIFTFKITEWGLAGPKERIIDVKAKTKNSAANKIIEMRGNRSWDSILVKIDGKAV